MASDALRNAEKKMQTSIEVLKREMGGVRTGRASPALIENIRIEYGGALVPLKQIAGLSAPQARLLVIQPWDKSSMREIEKAILKSELGLNPASDGSVIRLSIPPITEERRRELIKVVRRMVEDKKVAVRNLRQDAMKDLKGLEKNKEISQDELKRWLDQLQKLTDRFIADAEKIAKDKEAELTEI